MWKPGQTAEEFLSELAAELAAKAERIDVPVSAYAELPERYQVLAMGPMDDAAEMRRAVAGLEEALRVVLAPEPPIPDADRG